MGKFRDDAVMRMRLRLRLGLGLGPYLSIVYCVLCTVYGSTE
jgi:hypothetical protein